MTSKKSLDRFGTLSLGVTVVILYALFVTAVFSGFATYIYRTEWESGMAAGEDGLEDLDNLIFIVKRERTIETALADGRAEKWRLNARNKELTTQRESAFRGIGNLSKQRRNRVFTAIEGFVTDLSAPDRENLKEIIRTGGDDTSAIRINAHTDLALAALRGAALRDALPAQRAEEVEQIIRDLQIPDPDHVAKLNEFNAVAREAAAEIEPIQGQLAEIELDRVAYAARLSALREQVPPGSADRARFDALSTSVPLVGNMFQRLVSFPTIFLTLIVTIAAGGLGTVVSFSRRYYSRTEDYPSMARLFVNVGEGIAAAIAIFLFSGAGMLALTQGGGSANAVELSPYTVAFVAFLSGFMAEDAFGSIQAAGKRIFRRDHEAEGTPPPDAEPPVPDGDVNIADRTPG